MMKIRYILWLSLFCISILSIYAYIYDDTYETFVYIQDDVAVYSEMVEPYYIVTDEDIFFWNIDKDKWEKYKDKTDKKEKEKLNKTYQKYKIGDGSDMLILDNTSSIVLDDGESIASIHVMIYRDGGMIDANHSIYLAHDDEDDIYKWNYSISGLIDGDMIALDVNSIYDIIYIPGSAGDIYIRTATIDRYVYNSVMEDTCWDYGSSCLSFHNITYIQSVYDTPVGNITADNRTHALILFNATDGWSGFDENVTIDPISNATYIPGYGAPYCDYWETPCIAGEELLDSRDTLTPAEPNQPNTIDSCTDGTLGAYATGPYIKNITLTAANSTAFTELEWINVTAYVRCYTVDNYVSIAYANDTDTSLWRVRSQDNVCPANTLTPISKSIKLDNTTDVHGIRVITKLNTGNQTCPTGGFRDVDDIAFTVASSHMPIQDYPILSSSSGNNLTTDDLTLTPMNIYDAEGHPVWIVSNWYVDGIGLESIIYPFFGGTSTGASTLDYSDNGIDGTVTGATFNQGTPYGGYYDFDGNGDYIDITGIEDIMDRDSFSIEMMIDIDDLTPSAELEGHVIWIGESTGNGWGPEEEMHISINDPDNECVGIEFLYTDDVNNPPYATDPDVSIVCDDGVSIDTWYHIVVTFDMAAGLSTIYRDGVLIDSDDFSSQGVFSNAAWNAAYISRPGISTQREFDGQLAYVRIWNRTLTASQISFLNDTRLNNTEISADETDIGDIWQGCVAINDGDMDGMTLCSDNMTIVASQPPYYVDTCDDVTIYHDEDLMCQVNATDPESGPIVYGINDTRVSINATGYIYDNASLSDYNLPSCWNISYNVTDDHDITVNASFVYCINDTAPTLSDAWNMTVGWHLGELFENYDAIFDYTVYDAEKDTINVTIRWYVDMMNVLNQTVIGANDSQPFTTTLDESYYGLNQTIHLNISLTDSILSRSYQYEVSVYDESEETVAISDSITALSGSFEIFILLLVCILLIIVAWISRYFLMHMIAGLACMFFGFFLISLSVPIGIIVIVGSIMYMIFANDDS